MTLPMKKRPQPQSDIGFREIFRLIWMVKNVFIIIGMSFWLFKQGFRFIRFAVSLAITFGLLIGLFVALPYWMAGEYDIPLLNQYVALLEQWWYAGIDFLNDNGRSVF